MFNNLVETLSCTVKKTSMKRILRNKCYIGLFMLTRNNFS